MEIKKVKRNISYKPFFNNIIKEGLFFPNNFEATILLPTILKDKGYEPYLEIRCQSAPILTPTLETSVVKYLNDRINYPIGRTMEAISLTFLPNAEGKQHHIITEWVNMIMINNESYNIGWYDDYVGEIHIEVLSKSNEVIGVTKYIEVFPINCTLLELDKGKSNEVDRFNASFMFRTVN